MLWPQWWCAPYWRDVRALILPISTISILELPTELVRKIATSPEMADPLLDSTGMGTRDNGEALVRLGV
jgi:hypothetical protein